MTLSFINRVKKHYTIHNADISETESRTESFVNYKKKREIVNEKNLFFTKAQKRGFGI